MSIIKIVEEIVKKAKGYGEPMGKYSGGVAEAAAHTPTNAPSEDEDKKETNPANSGTHPKAGGAAGSGNRPEGGEDFKSGGAKEDEIKGSGGPSGRAPQGHPDALKHEGGGSGPNHPGTATTKQSQQKSEGEADLTKDHGEEKEEKDDKDDKAGEKDDKDDAEKSEGGEVLLDIDEFAAELVTKAVSQATAILREEFGPALSKSQESEFVEAGLAKSIVATLDRLEEVEKAIVNIGRVLNVRKSLLNSADNIKGIDNPSLSKSTLSKSEISSRLLDLQMKGDSAVDSNMVLKFDAVGDPSILPDVVKSKIGL